MKITKIEPQKKHKNRMSVFLDGEFSFGIDSFTLFSLHLAENDEITEEKLSSIKQTILFEDAKNKAAKLLSARSYTARDMKKKLLEYTGDEETSEKTLAFLKEYRLIDDKDYARRFANDCLHIKKLGKRNIRMKLIEKGISATLADETIEALDTAEEEKENLEKILMKKIGTNFEFKNLMKAKRYAASRGYDFDEIDSAIRTIKEAQEEF